MIARRRSRLKGLGVTSAAAAALLAAGFVVEGLARRSKAIRFPSGNGDPAERFHLSGSGEAGTPGIVLLPGAGDTTASWVLVEERLNRTHQVLTYERAPVGAARVRDGGHLAAVVQELETVIAASGLSAPVVLVGHSFGGLVARAYAAVHPEHVAGVVLVDTTPTAVADAPSVRVGFAIAAGSARVLRALSSFGLVRAMVALNAMPLYPEQRRFRQSATPSAYRRWAAAVTAGFAAGAADELGSVLPDVRSFTASAAAPVSAPVALVHSSAYGRKWEQMQRDLAEEVRAVSVYPTGQRRHNIQMSSPELIERAVSDVLGALSGQADR